MTRITWSGSDDLRRSVLALQPRFLLTVALHSGFCLRRQYAAFARVGYGAVVRDFLDGLVHWELATRIAYRCNRGFVYHLSTAASTARSGRRTTATGGRPVRRSSRAS